MSSSNKYTIPRVQRALVLQGGGALGAYQAGVFKSLYEKMKTSVGKNLSAYFCFMKNRTAAIVINSNFIIP